MVITTPDRPPITAIGRNHRPLRLLDRRADFAQNISPNWFATIMGTGIVAVALAGLPVQLPGQHVVATLVWILAAVALTALVPTFVRHWVRHRRAAWGHWADPVMSQFYGALPMALLTVGTGTLLLGTPILGAGAAVGVDILLWSVGTALGLTTTVVALVRLLGRGRLAQGSLLPAHLMPVVPPMVSATAGALLVPHLGSGRWGPFQPGAAMLVGCYGLFLISLTVGMPILIGAGVRILRGNPPTGKAAPTVWILLGLVGQSITAANLLGKQAHLVLPGEVARGLEHVGVVYGTVAAIVGSAVFALLAVLTVRAFRRGLGFSLTWWSFTFPIGTCVTGATALAAGVAAVGGPAPVLALLRGVAVGLCALLVFAWSVVAARTVRRSWSGELLLPS
ncbi:C4-dicarboxylate ABC transporter [Nakamurella silvestris]|nr:C4-dicarboxylate ABC transporter [Nakamurella silvestris]